MRQELVKTACARDCYDTCFLDAYVAGGRLSRVAGSKDSLITLGVTCPRARADPSRLYSNRILHPHMRVGGKPGGGFRRVAWDEALDLVASKLAEVLEKHGAEAVLHLEYAGNMGLLTWYYPQRLWNALGATATDYSICSRTGHEALELHYGSSHGLRPEELPNMRLGVLGLQPGGERRAPVAPIA